MSNVHDTGGIDETHGGLSVKESCSRLGRGRVRRQILDRVAKPLICLA